MNPTVTISPRGEQRLQRRASLDLPRRYRRGERGAGDTRRRPQIARDGCSARPVTAIARRITPFACSLERREAVADEALIAPRIAAAIAFRESLDIDATAYRLIHGEADLLPSLIVDRYSDYLVVQALSQGIDRLMPVVTELLVELMHPTGILARNDPRVRLLEGLEQTVEVLHGTVPDQIDVREGHGVVPRGSVSRAEDRVRSSISGRTAWPQRSMRADACLTAFSYNGGFALALAAHCDEVIAIDISEDAVARIRANAERNGGEERRGTGDERVR